VPALPRRHPKRFSAGFNIVAVFGVPYFPGEEPLELAGLWEISNRRVMEALQQLPDCELVMELGRYWWPEAGIYVCTMQDKKCPEATTSDTQRRPAS